MAELEFSNMNPYDGLQFLTSRSTEGLKDQLDQIKFPIKIIAIYSSGNQHVCWFLSQRKIKKKTENKSAL